MKVLKQAVQYPCIVILAALSAVNYAVFIFPNSFAPAGIDGLCTMLQSVTGISMGYPALVVNVPLLVAAFILLKREFAAKTAVYVLAFSASTILLRQVDLSAFVYHTGTGTSIVLAPIAAGAIRGILYALTLRLNASSGGTDIVAAIVRRFKPHLDLMNVIFVINLLIALCSYFVYGFQPEPVICSILYSFITSGISNRVRSGEHTLIKFEIIAPDADALCAQIFDQLHRTATVMDAQGAYSGADKKLIVCVIDRKTAPALERLVQQQPDTVYFQSVVNDAALS